MQSRTGIIVVLLICVAAGSIIAGCTQQATPAPTPATAGMANPASVNCGKLGGTTEILKNPDGSEYGMCKFTNGTSCEEWALFRGEGCKAGGTAVKK